MKLERLHYRVEVELKFTEEEIDYLIDRAQRHYDGACQAAGTSIAEGARTNGFIAQLRLFPQFDVIWTGREVDLALKVLEFADLGPTKSKKDVLRKRLREELNSAFTVMEQRYIELRGEKKA